MRVCVYGRVRVCACVCVCVCACACACVCVCSTVYSTNCHIGQQHVGFCSLGVDFRVRATPLTP